MKYFRFIIQQIKTMKLCFKWRYVFFLSTVFIFNNSAAQTWRGKHVETGQKYDYVGTYYEGLARVKLEKKWGFIDTSGQLVIKPKYDQVENFSEGLAKVRSGHRGWGLINKKGEEILKPMFDYIGDFIGDEALIRSGGKEAFIDRNGNMIRKN